MCTNLSKMTNDEKKRNPTEKANFLSYLTYFYMFPIFKRTFKHGMREEDLFEPLDEHKSDFLGEELETIWKEEYRSKKKFALFRALFKIYGSKFLWMGILRLFEEVALVVAMPLAIGCLVSYFEISEEEISRNEAYLYAGLIVLCRLVDPVIAHASMMTLMHQAMKMRLACSSLIYRKLLKLNKASLVDTTVGQLVNLLSNDVSKFDQGFALANFVFVAPIQAAFGTYLLYHELGVSALFGMVLLISFVPIQGWFGKKCSTLRLKIARKTDKRVRLMNEVINGMQVIKMYCWERPFEQLISLVRRQEMKGIRSRGYVLGMVYCFEMFITRVSIFVSVVGYVLLGNNITAKRMFAVTSIYVVLRPVITTIFSLSINSIAEVYVSVKRIEKFLSLEELQEVTLNQNGGIPEEKTISLKNVSAKWNPTSIESTLENLSFSIVQEKLVAVIGAVGSGKSSLFNVILKELPIIRGELKISGKISYCSQEPWLFNGSIRENILFGNKFEKDKYQEVVKVCALQSDFEQLPHADRTLVGERGKVLSGGQKARINLARCIYKSADIYLLDDPLSAVDTNVGRHLYEKCIKNYLKEKLCLLITHQLQYVSGADKILVLEDGEIILEGNYNDLQNSGLDFTKLLTHFNNEEVLEQSYETVQPTKPSQERLETSPLLEKEFMETGVVKPGLYLTYFKAGGGFFNAFLMLTVFILAQVVSSSADYFVTYWVNKEEDWRVSNETFPRDNLLYTYSGIILAVFAFGIAHGIYFMFFLALASSTLHQLSFTRLMKATMRFFDGNPSGRILNRFSRDLGNVDEYIPSIIYDVIAVALDLFGAIILSVFVDFWLVLPSFLLLLLFYGFRQVYIKTSRSVKRIEGITRSPIYGHMSSSIDGLSTIRAFSAQELCLKEFDEYQDKHSSAYYIFMTSNRCFGFWIDTTSAFFIAFAIFVLLYFKQDLHGGDLGLVITQFIGLAGGLQWGMRQWSELENQMISIERILEYTKLETDPDRIQSFEIPKSWPENGKIEFKNVSLSYKNYPVLHKLNFTIYPREKIGIVGRTGAGKSSMITALFQLYPIEGKIIIDGIDTTKIPLDKLRNKISIIPQEPVLFSGTLRQNLDPFEEYEDEVLWRALEEVEMKDAVQELGNGLHSFVSEGGSNFSVGQRQLICLARALMRKNRVLVMDEATANVDPYTDAFIQSTIRKKFADCTVLTIAHRLHTVMDSDRILVMNAGIIEEFEHPYVLLNNKNGFFYDLVQKTGQTTAKNLAALAKERFLQRTM